MKEYTILCNRQERITSYTGTIPYLVNEVFGYKLQCGHEYNSKINKNPKTIKSLITALNDSARELQPNTIPDYYQLQN